VTPAQIDSAFSLPRNLLAFKTIFTVPALWFVGLMATLMWLMPLASLQSVGSLTTRVVPHSDVESCDVPSVNFAQNVVNERTDFVSFLGSLPSDPI
jgi:hypothetical protein